MSHFYKSQKTQQEEMDETFSTLKLIANLKAATELNTHIEGLLRKKFDRTQLNQSQKSVAKEITNIVISNCDVDKWVESAASYVDKPVDTNSLRVDEILSLAQEFDVDSYSAALLYVSKSENSVISE